MCHNEKSNMINLDKLDHMIRQLRERIELDNLHNLCQGDLSVREFIARFEDLTCHYDVRAPFSDHSHICFRFKV